MAKKREVESKPYSGILRRWLPLAFLTTMLCGILYITLQQNYRQSANDPQIELAMNLTTALSNGQSLDSFNNTQRQDLTQTLSPFYIIYDEKGAVAASSVELQGNVPTIPSGVLAYAKDHGQNRLTWQPAPGVREAVVVDYFHGKNSGYVLVGRSLKEVEKRVNDLTLMTGLGWVATMAGTVLLTLL